MNCPCEYERNLGSRVIREIVDQNQTISTENICYGSWQKIYFIFGLRKNHAGMSVRHQGLQKPLGTEKMKMLDTHIEFNFN